MTMRRICTRANFARMSESLNEAVSRARAALDRAQPQDPSPETVAALREAVDAATQALNEAMAATVVRGASVRQVAGAAGMAPNSVAPRLAETAALREYAEGERVTSEGIARARHAARMTFQPRRPT